MTACPLPAPPAGDLGCLISQWNAHYDRNTRGTAGDRWRCLECPAGQELLEAQKMRAAKPLEFKRSQRQLPARLRNASPAVRRAYGW